MLFAGEPETLSAQQKMQKAMVMAKARTIKKMQGNENEIEEKSLETVAPIKVDTKKPKVKVVFSQNKKRKGIKTSPGSKKVQKNLSQSTVKQVCKSSKKSLRELEIEEALSFYAKSSFYSFRQ